ncbi:hypothetical protein SUGI_0919080 [Cryptomeria japonica]|nr:hypothetical protein SUGI_0919080 [Cryptomeria japonica]
MASGSEFKKGYWTKEEDRLLKQHIQLHGEAHWSSIPITSGRMPGRTDNEVKNYWYSRLKHRVLGNKVLRSSVSRLTAKRLNNPAKSLPTEIESAKWKDACIEAQGQDIALEVGEEMEEPSKCDAFERDGYPSEVSPCNFYLFEESNSLLHLCYEEQSEIEHWL